MSCHIFTYFFIFFISIFSNLFSGAAKPDSGVHNLSNQLELLNCCSKEADKIKKFDKRPLLFVDGDSEFRFTTKFRPEFFRGKNLEFINSANHLDQVQFFRHTIDLIAEYKFGNKTCKRDVILFKMVLRNQGIWGDVESIAHTVDAELKRLGAVGGSHKHSFPRHIPWIRELWMQMSLSDLLNFPFCNIHTFTLGAFPFELGRGISLGAAYGVGADFIGYYAEAAINQYAFGGKLSGEIFKDKLTYDIYGAILDNKQTSSKHTTAPVLKNQYGHFFNPARGFGIINYVVAARLKWYPKVCNGKVSFEPYFLFNHNNEQKIEFISDAHSKLYTAGLAGEFQVGRWGFGFDTALNFGHLNVKGWDRNHLIEQNRDGFEAIVNNKVNQIDPVTGKSNSALDVSENQKIINASVPKDKCEMNFEINNGAVIGSNSLGTLVNAKDRFRDPFFIKFNGAMLVFDVGYTVIDPKLTLNGTIGFASGDENPLKELSHIPSQGHEFTYGGFISLQEVYSGKRVKSAFLLSGSGRIPRFLSFPTEEAIDPFPSAVTRFTNILFTGGGAQIKLPETKNKWSINPNFLWYWHDTPPIIFRTLSSGILNQRETSRYLGFEFNTFVEAELLPDLNFFGVGALFVPGTHFHHIKGIPTNKDQKKYLEALRKLSSSDDLSEIEKVPLLGTDKAWLINFGLEYKF